MRRTLRMAFPAAMSALFFAGILWLLGRELSEIRLDALGDAIRDIAPGAIVAGLALTAMSYMVLSAYDLLAVRHLGYELAYGRVMRASFVSYACNFNLGAVVGGAASRYRLYGAWGLGPADVTVVNLFCIVTNWLGFAIILGLVLLIRPDTILPLILPVAMRPLGGVCVALPIAYVALCAWRRSPIVVRQRTYALPHVGIALAQVGVATLQWLLPSAVLWVLQAGDDMTYPSILAAHLLASVAGLVVRVPGALGVVEAVFLGSFRGIVPRESVLASLLAFRGIYLLVPLLVASAVLLMLELHRRRAGVVAHPVSRS